MKEVLHFLAELFALASLWFVLLAAVVMYG